MKHIDLFSGIGGFSYAADQVWELEHVFCDIDPFCRAVTNKHWPGSIHYADIRQLIADTEREGYNGGSATVLSEQTGMEQEKQKRESSRSATARRNDVNHASDTEHSGQPRAEKAGTDSSAQSKGTTGKKLSKPELAGGDSIWTQEARRDTFLVTGGFPCQPFSQAGRRRGTGDDRYLWPEMFAVIRNTQPTWVIGENVGGLVTWNEGMVLEQVCADLESEGYEVQPFIIPACAVNAPHRRDRVWIVGYAEGKRKRLDGICEGAHEKQTGRPGGDNAGNSGIEGFPDGYERAVSGQETDKERQRPTSGYFTSEQWNENWIEVATRLCGVDDGLPAGVDGLELSKAGHRRERLKALGNAIVPEVAVEIMKAMASL